MTPTLEEILLTLAGCAALSSRSATGPVQAYYYRGRAEAFQIAAELVKSGETATKEKTRAHSD